ncbi:late embryogenesis abundant protein 6-like [Syzygium oleosum]|uniref:late embryogenesis abundant protein 6-like n=1 Tax=Syzygium oleosum TaxID=219896 RepID=UPI0024B8B9C1|nr:late embryogenesis abundant protein 6-like [Syzygium oleosum]
MQAIKEKLSEMNTARKVKAEARADEKAEKDYAKARAGVAHEVRLAREAEADMDKHVNKAERLARKELAKHGDGGPRNNNGYGSYTNSDQRATDPIGAGNATTYEVKIASPSQASSAPPSNKLL